MENMELTEQNKAEIKLIAQTIIKDFSADVKDELKDLANNLKEMLVAHNLTIDSKLDAITRHFTDQIQMIGIERKNDIAAESSERKLCRSESELRFQKIESNLVSLSEKMITNKQVWIISGKICAAVSGLITIILGIVSVIK